MYKVLKPLHGITNVAAAGTEVRLTATPTLVSKVLIVAKDGNTGNIFVGGALVSSTSYGVTLTAGESVSLSAGDVQAEVGLIDLSTIWIDCSVSGEGVSYLYFAD